MRKSEIKRGIGECIEKLDRVLVSCAGSTVKYPLRTDVDQRDLPKTFQGPAVRPTPGASASDQETDPPDLEDGARYSEGVGDEPATAVTGTDHDQVLSLRSPRMRIMTWMVNAQGIRINLPPPHSLEEHETQESQPAESRELPPVKRLDGMVTRDEDRPFAGGTYCEVWVGLWDRGGGIDGGEADEEKVNTSLTTSILLTFPL